MDKDTCVICGKSVSQHEAVELEDCIEEMRRQRDVQIEQALVGLRKGEGQKVNIKYQKPKGTR